MDPRIIQLYDEYTHAPLPRRVFLDRLAKLVGGSAAAAALLPMLEPNYARAEMIPANDPRLVAERVSYPGATGSIKAYLAHPKTGNRWPAVIVVHENRGLNPHIEDVARRAAVAGFLALAPDLLSPVGGTPADADEARQKIEALDRGKAAADCVAAANWLGSHASSTGKVGAVGFCWGGGVINRLAVAAPAPLAAATAFYGEVPPASDVPKIKAHLLLHYAGLDQRINAGIPEFEKALKAAGVRYSLNTYENVNHAFHNDTAGDRYDERAARQAWQRTIDFFKATLVGGV
ncbi:MAG: dienelactone hydrolase family protein [Proteobacteria bacterium]|nr:dienelactone hydrolase family protein [Pseudomonadota bacterium]MBI3496844.1 dienelactone hydrolase family protein [Pseudomonadota bacterium]